MDDGVDSRESLGENGTRLGLECDSFYTTFDPSLGCSVVGYF